MEPTAGKCLLCRLGSVPIALQQVGAANDQLADTPGWDNIHLIIHDASFQMHQGPSDRAGFFKRQFFGQCGDTRRSFAHSKALLQHNARFMILLHQANRQRRAATHYQPHVFKGPGIKLRMLNQRQENGRHTEKKGYPFFFKQCQRFCRIKGPLDDHRTAIIKHG